jgi:hypothetical protein
MFKRNKDIDKYHFSLDEFWEPSAASKTWVLGTICTPGARTLLEWLRVRYNTAPNYIWCIPLLSPPRLGQYDQTDADSKLSTLLLPV